MKERKSFWLIGVVLLCAVVFMIAMISTKDRYLTGEK